MPMHTHPARARTTPIPTFYRAELERFYFDAVDLRRPRRSDSERRRLLPARRIGDESIIVTRDASGEIHALFNVCRHRGTRICDRPTGISPAASSVRITRGPTTSTAGCSPRRT